ncbi:MAG: UbiA family prenyltransferase [Verrucomicrobiota bacterium]
MSGTPANAPIKFWLVMGRAAILSYFSNRTLLPMPPRQKLLLLLASARVANLPSVVSNVWLGVALGVLVAARWPPPSPWSAATLLAVSAMLLYVSGNFFNDWHDRHWDAQHRPERGLPRGVFTPALYLGLAIVCSTLGVALAWWSGPGCALVAAAIVLCMVSYTRWHKQTPEAVLLLGMCRALLPLLFFIEWPLGCAKPNLTHAMAETRLEIMVIAPHALALLFYVTGLSWIARGEAKAAPPRTSRWHAYFLLVLAGFFMASWYVPTVPKFGLLGLLPFGLWLGLCFTRFAKSPREQISALLAGIPLLDWVALLPLSLSMINHGQSTPLALTCLFLPPLAFIAGRLLQRLAAAT